MLLPIVTLEKYPVQRSRQVMFWGHVCRKRPLRSLECAFQRRLDKQARLVRLETHPKTPEMEVLCGTDCLKSVPTRPDLGPYRTHCQVKNQGIVQRFVSDR